MTKPLPQEAELREADRYFELLFERRQLKAQRRKFMETYECDNPEAFDDYSQPIDCVEWKRSGNLHKSAEMCQPCKNRHHFYVELMRNGHERAVITRKRLAALSTPSEQPNRKDSE